MKRNFGMDPFVIDELETASESAIERMELAVGSHFGVGGSDGRHGRFQGGVAGGGRAGSV